MADFPVRSQCWLRRDPVFCDAGLQGISYPSWARIIPDATSQTTTDWRCTRLGGNSNHHLTFCENTLHYFWNRCKGTKHAPLHVTLKSYKDGFGRPQCTSTLNFRAHFANNDRLQSQKHQDRSPYSPQWLWEARSTRHHRWWSSWHPSPSRMLFTMAILCQSWWHIISKHLMFSAPVSPGRVTIVTVKQYNGLYIGLSKHVSSWFYFVVDSYS